MAERRMFSKLIIDSDMFLDMPLSTQCLYFHLSMRADDDGFVNNPRKIQKTIGCNEDDLKLLTAKQFIIPFESGICVIKHWKIHNYIQKDRYKPTIYHNEKDKVSLNESSVYELNDVPAPACIQNGYSMDTSCTQNGYPGKVRLGKDSIELSNNSFVASSSNADTTSKKDYTKEMELCNLLFDLMKQNNPKVKQPNFNNWCKFFDYILRIDKRDFEEVKQVITWCQHDSFWNSNILSARKLREKYDQLYLRMKEGINNGRANTKNNTTSQKPKYNFSCFE